LTDLWYVIRAASRREFDAVEALTENGFSAYVPQGVRWHSFRRSADREKDRIYYPLFSGYLFVGCLPEQFDDVLAISGVHDFLRVPNEAGILVPLPVSEALIAGIADEESRGVYDVTRPSKREKERADRIAKGYKPGERVMVLNGAYAGFLSSVLRMTSKNRRAVIEGPNGVLTLDVRDLEIAV
jgi:transcription antitermination factor NusG